MKRDVNDRWPTVLAGLALAVAMASSHSQTLTMIRSFGILTNVTGLDPQSPLVQGPDGSLYGSTSFGEGSVGGTLFKVQPDGSGFTVLKWFTNSLEGASPSGGLTLSGSVLYGTTEEGGSSNAGTVFSINTNGTGYAVLYNFTGTPDGVRPTGGLVLSGSILYGTTLDGGSSEYGTVFQLNADGTAYSVSYSFAGAPDGAYPVAGLTLSGTALYGTTGDGGMGGSGGFYGNGTVFSLNTDGTGYTVLYYFGGGAEGRKPVAALTLADGVLFGTTFFDGAYGNGTVFKLNTDGTGYGVLHSFTGGPGGGGPFGGLTLSGSSLYGTAFNSSSSGSAIGPGIVFQLSTDGTGYSVLKGFTGSDGSGPWVGLMLAGSVLYGTTAEGGSSDRGTVFKLNTDGTGYTVLKNFVFSGAAYPLSSLSASDGALYGTALSGGSYGGGTVFEMNTDGTRYTVLHNFGGIADGGGPSGGLTLSGGVFYGTTRAFGRSTSTNLGTVFKLNTDGTGYSVLHNFAGPDGEDPEASLTLSGGVLYGTTWIGGSYGLGTVFKVNTDGTGHTVLHNFTGGADGGYISAGLALSGGVLYGTAYGGGSSRYGTVFKLNTDGTGYAVLHTFTDTPDGASPEGGLALSEAVLYGTTRYGGSSNSGTVFKVNADGTGYTVLWNFSGAPDGAYPYAGLALSGGVLYGTTSEGGSSGDGTVFNVNPDGTGYSVLYNFTGVSDGAGPSADLTLMGGVLYGTTSGGGNVGDGTVFSLSLPFTLPELSISPAGGNVVLIWPTNATGFSLQSTTNLGLSAVWTTNLPSPVVVSGQNTVTNPISGTQQFYRLSQ